MTGRKSVRRLLVIFCSCLVGFSAVLTIWRQSFFFSVRSGKAFIAGPKQLQARAEPAARAPMVCFGAEFEHHGFTTRLLASIDEPVKHVVVVLAGEDPSILELEQTIRQDYPFCTIIRKKQRIGNVGIWNTCVRYMLDVAKVPWALLLNNDIMMPPGSLGNVSVEAQRVVQNPEFCLGPTKLRNVRKMLWSALVVSRRTAQIAGFFDENIFPAYYEDNEFSIRIRKIHESGTPCRLFPVRARNTFHHGPADSPDYISGTVIYYNGGGDRSKKVIQDRANAWNPHYVALKWDCPLYLWEKCKNMHPFGRSDLSPKDWAFDPGYRHCLETGESGGQFGCRYNVSVLPREPASSQISRVS